MTTAPAPSPEVSEEVRALIETLHVTGQRLEELTAGEVDTVANREGKPFLLRRAQDHQRVSVAAKQSAILNALPAHIALLDAQGRIVAVNTAWCRFGNANSLTGPVPGLGLNYLDLCDGAEGLDSAPAHAAAAGIRSVLHAQAPSFTMEYACHAPTEPHWFQMSVTPLFEDHPNGVVVMHLDISARKAAEDRIVYLNRVYATLSGINTLIVRVRDRDTLFSEACRVAVEAGGFQMALIGTVDRDTQRVALVASSGVDAAFGAALAGHFASLGSGAAGNAVVARVISENKRVVVNELQNNPAMVFEKVYAERGVNSMAILPLILVGQTVGLLTLYASEPDFFRDEELKLLDELACDVAFAMDHIDKQERIDYLVYYDVLTGLANQHLFLERLAQYMQNAASAGHQLAVYLIDLERFKNINDSLGQAAGDALLRQAAQWLTHNVGDATLFARLGADHFAAVLPVVQHADDVARFLEGKREAFQEHPFLVGDAVLRVAIKVGSALFPRDGADAASLFKNAEAALKQAKARGEPYLLYTPAMTAAVANKVALENQLRLALDRGEFVLHYQPKVNLATGAMTSAEALLRWNDPRTGLVPPGQFIPVLEETGLIHAVGRWALRQAIADYLRWRAAGLAVVRIAVNVSPLQLRNRNFIDEVRKAISIDPHAQDGVELEITESLIMEDVKHSIASLQAIRTMGLTVAIDDFGTGFSSLSYLAKFPVDTLKIDRSFVLDMTESPEGLALVSTIINLAHALRLKVVAEGVDSEDQLRLLRVLGCDEMQGYLFSQPVPSAVFEAKYLVPSAVN
ncbi:EAL domain-containing protein [Rhodoferax sp. AJA081-3]|uniref:sensor domain-containing protein n=1 Tax=Rhodoferax sp. AJA081-3 TaxID=2752316 RepID=UPI001BB68EDF|nr:EAL domain-containing protein [Rhodoferax sp. AJA081-3]QTN27537.1 EAL domain-containing protein [Rhodoferax sp. AJA081-3]